MHTIFVITSLGLAATLVSAGIYGKAETVSLGGHFPAAEISTGFAGSLSNAYSAGLGSYADLTGAGGGGDHGSSYSGPSSYEVADQGSSGGGGHSGGGGGGGGDSGDYHHGVSIVANGAEPNVPGFDLTSHGGGSGHHGPFGGSFIASAKYEGHSGIAHKVADGDSSHHGGGSWITFGSPHYTDVLGASDDGGSSSHGGGGGGGGDSAYKWGLEGPASSEYLGDH